jgi:hypothetical protein
MFHCLLSLFFCHGLLHLKSQYVCLCLSLQTCVIVIFCWALLEIAECNLIQLWVKYWKFSHVIILTMHSHYRTYDPNEFSHLPVSSEVKGLFQNITRWVNASYLEFRNSTNMNYYSYYLLQLHTTKHRIGLQAAAIYPWLYTSCWGYWCIP